LSDVNCGVYYWNKLTSIGRRIKKLSRTLTTMTIRFSWLLVTMRRKVRLLRRLRRSVLVMVLNLE
jgi:hypothetical protein